MSVTPNDPTNPHIAVIYLFSEVHERLPDGSASGNPVEKKRMTLHLKGIDRWTCERRLNEAIEELMKCCATS
jgi:hypothetical protein